MLRVVWTSEALQGVEQLHLRVSRYTLTLSAPGFYAGSFARICKNWGGGSPHEITQTSQKNLGNHFETPTGKNMNKTTAAQNCEVCFVLKHLGSYFVQILLRFHPKRGRRVNRPILARNCRDLLDRGRRKHGNEIPWQCSWQSSVELSGPFTSKPHIFMCGALSLFRSVRANVRLHFRHSKSFLVPDRKLSELLFLHIRKCAENLSSFCRIFRGETKG